VNLISAACRYPGNMRAKGKALVSSIITDMRDHGGLVPDAKELALLEVAGDLTDVIEDLKRSLRRDGYMQEIKSGRLVPHPAVSHIRQASLALAKVLEGVQMSAQPAVDRKRQAAAKARWRAHNEAKAKEAAPWAGA
jgi:ribosomal protein S21